VTVPVLTCAQACAGIIRAKSATAQEARKGAARRATINALLVLPLATRTGDAVSRDGDTIVPAGRAVPEDLRKSVGRFVKKAEKAPASAIFRGVVYMSALTDRIRQAT